ncbi:unnamed protein product [Somion occarium]|uniref:CSC1/OSCA1-like 7TM region domain-containing protein n=1 Tax=Somion occarium TaxID=3059160 RepID=A0ABP1CEN3_9APHY
MFMTSLSTPTVIHLTQQRPKRQSDNDIWWASSSSSSSQYPPSSPSATSISSHSSVSNTPPSLTTSPPVILTSSTGQPQGSAGMSGSSNSRSTQSSTLNVGSSNVDTTFLVTTSTPVTITRPSSTFTSFSEATFTSSRVASTLPESQSVASSLRVNPVCIGNGVDSLSVGLLSTIVIPTAVGLVLWLLFAIIRPRFREIYGLREWFVQQNLRPKPLSRSLWAFLFPHVPLVPPVPDDVSEAGRSPTTDAELFPSDEALSQRTLWVCFVVVLGWTILALAGLLPLYMVSTPCLAESADPSRFSGAYSVLQDMSLLRLIRLLDNENVNSNNNFVIREIVNGKDYAPNARIRIIILTVLAIVLGVIPVLWKIMREFNRLVAHRRRWVDIKCQGQEMAWLSARYTPGFFGWGEKRLKDFIVKSGLSSSLDSGEGRNGNGRSRRRRQTEWSNEEKVDLEIDVQSLFSVGDTTQLALLIEERDEILENLEIAETKYISSFKLTTPDPSMIDLPVPPPPPDGPTTPSKPQISRPRPLAGSARRRKRGRNPAYGSSSLPPPTSFVMPSQYYKLRGVQGVSGGQFTDAEGSIQHQGPSLTDSFNQRVVGSRFHEVKRDSVAFGRLPMGSQVVLEKNGQMGPGPSSVPASPVPGPAPFAPNGYTSWDTGAFDEFSGQQWFHHPEVTETIEEEGDEDWVDVMHEAPEAFENGEEYSTTRRRPRPPRARTTSPEKRETFPLRNKNATDETEQTPPHLRLQPRQPFVRPLSGLDHADLGHIYSDISHWRSKLKVINNEISDVQRDGYNEIADGMGIKGWLMVGRGLRHIPGVQLIEGRAKEDIRWDELQNEGGFLRGLAFWTIILTVGILLGAALTAVSGLYLATAPDFAHYFPFFESLTTGSELAAGAATGLAAAVGATVFISLALAIVHYTGQLSHSVSISGTQLVVFRITFYILTIIAAIWLFSIGAILFSMGAFNTQTLESASVANGAIYMSAFALMLIMNVAVIFPALLLLQPIRLWRVVRAEREAVTPRQRFRAVYPRTYDPTYATGCCVLAVLLASAFALIFPLLAPGAVVLLFLTLIAHRFLIGYVYGRTHSQTGGLLSIWLLKRFSTVLAFQPLILGLILLTRRLWVEGGILCGVALFVALFVEIYCTWRTRLPGRRSLSPITRDSLDTFMRTARPSTSRDNDEESTSLVSSARTTRARGSFASILEMMSLTLAVMPSASQSRGPVPLETETLDDLTATERAARTHPDAPPHLPPLPFADHAEEMAGILYAPELLAPPPVIWLPNDVGGIGRSEAYDLQRYHNLRVTLDVRAKEDVLLPRRSSSDQARRIRNAS